MTLPRERVSPRGYLDGLAGRVIAGWAVDPDGDGLPLEIEVLIDGELVGTAVADQYRQDLADAGIGAGRNAFALPVPVHQWCDGQQHEVRALVAGTDFEIPGSPRRELFGGSPEVRWIRAPFAADTVRSRDGSIQALREQLRVRGRLALMACFQPSSQPSSYLLTYLRALRQENVAIVIIDTTPGGLSVPADLAPFVVRRENLGWDFASWLVGLDAVRELIAETQELVLANDSVFGPFHELTALWDDPRLDGADFWGLTDSWQHSYHLQSYFLVLRRSALEDPAVWEFANQYPFPISKRRVIVDGEIGLTSALHRAGLRSAVLYPYEQVARAWLDDLPVRLARIARYPENVFAQRLSRRGSVGDDLTPSLRQAFEVADCIRRGVALNPTHHFWDTLIERFEFPFVKRELLHVNPSEIPLGTEFARVLSATGYDIEHVRDAARRARNVRVATL
jgi:hypothetical protein